MTRGDQQASSTVQDEKLFERLLAMQNEAFVVPPKVRSENETFFDSLTPAMDRLPPELVLRCKIEIMQTMEKYRLLATQGSDD